MQVEPEPALGTLARKEASRRRRRLPSFSSRSLDHQGRSERSASYGRRDSERRGISFLRGEIARRKVLEMPARRTRSGDCEEAELAGRFFLGAAATSAAGARR